MRHSCVAEPREERKRFFKVPFGQRLYIPLERKQLVLPVELVIEPVPLLFAFEKLEAKRAQSRKRQKLLKKARPRALRCDIAKRADIVKILLRLGFQLQKKLVPIRVFLSGQMVELNQLVAASPLPPCVIRRERPLL